MNSERIRTLDAIDAEMALVHEQVVALMRHGDFDTQMQVSMNLDHLVEAVDAAVGYFELHPAALAEKADRVVLVDRSGTEPVESTYPIADWHREGPQILAAALRLWSVAGGRVRLSGSALRGRGTVTTQSGSYIACAWYAADENGAIWPEQEVEQ